MSNKIKQVIVMRTQYPDGKGGTTGIRKGKMIAQGAHASMAFLSSRIRDALISTGFDGFSMKNVTIRDVLELSKVEEDWLKTSFAKVCVRVSSEEELWDIYKQAQSAGLEVHLITDSGKTEFNGEPTDTCLAIGPDLSEKIDPITGHLELL